MTEQPEARRGEAAWKQQREAVAKRNADTHRRAQEEKKQRSRQIDAQTRVRDAREAEELNELNARIAERRSGGQS